MGSLSKSWPLSKFATHRKTYGSYVLAHPCPSMQHKSQQGQSTSSQSAAMKFIPLLQSPSGT